MSSLITAKIKSKADELYHGDEICQQKAKQLLSEISLPNGLLPLKQNKSYTHKFEKIDKLVDYAPEGIAIVEKGKIKKLTGVKTNELLVWVRLSDIYVQREVLFNSRSDSTQPAVPLLRNSPRFDQLKSKSTITGTISPNKLPSRIGVGVKVLFLWLDIVEIIWNGDNLEFLVWIASVASLCSAFFFPTNESVLG
ncbi:hypothetical protein ACFX2B_013310 [Malus domestica]